MERCLGPEGYAQRTSYAINQPGMPTRQLTRTVVIRPARDERANDPNLPPTYDQAVTGKDRSVKVEDGSQADGNNLPPTANVPPPPQQQQGQATPSAPPPIGNAPGPMPRFAPPPFSQVPRSQNTGTFRSYLGTSQPAPPGYSAVPSAPPSAPEMDRDRSDSLDADDQTALLQ